MVGVLPQEFEMPQLGEIDVMLPARLDASLPRSANSSSFLRTFARLREGVSIEQARDQMRPLFEESTAKDVPPELRSEVRLVVRSLRDRQIHDVKLASWLLFGSVLALLLVACTNVANLMLARTEARRRELAMRAALGAGRGRLMRQTLTESLMFGLLGGAAGCGAAWVLLRLFVSLAFDEMPRLAQARIDLRALLFALAGIHCRRRAVWHGARAGTATRRNAGGMARGRDRSHAFPKSAGLSPGGNFPGIAGGSLAINSEPGEARESAAGFPTRTRPCGLVHFTTAPISARDGTSHISLTSWRQG